MGAFLYSHDNSANPSYISNCQFYENRGEISLFDHYMSSVVINDSIFFNNSNLAFYSIRSNINISNISFSDHVCKNKEGCIFALSQTSFLYLENSVFKNILNLENVGNMAFDSSIVIFEKILMRNLSTHHKIGTCSTLDSTILNISDVLFQNYFGNCIYASESLIEILNSNFINDITTNFSNDVLSYGGIFCLSCFSFNLVNSSFINNKNVLSGACLYFLNNKDSKDQKAIFFISNSSFQNNSAIFGGAIYMLNIKILISFSFFSNNLAQKGGAIYFDCDSKILILSSLNIFSKH